jgi:hypothetical protein
MRADSKRRSRFGYNFKSCATVLVYVRSHVERRRTVRSRVHAVSRASHNSSHSSVARCVCVKLTALRLPTACVQRAWNSSPNRPSTCHRHPVVQHEATYKTSDNTFPSLCGPAIEHSGTPHGQQGGLAQRRHPWPGELPGALPLRRLLDAQCHIRKVDACVCDASSSLRRA